MKFDLTKPCAHCPFRRSVEFPLGTDRRLEIAQSLASDYNTFPCHETTHFDEEGVVTPHDNEQHCAGAMIVLERHNRPNIMMRIAQMSGSYQPERLRDRADVYSSLQEFAASDPEEL